jgi:hypothetical protein
MRSIAFTARIIAQKLPKVPDWACSYVNQLLKRMVGGFGSMKHTAMVPKYVLLYPDFSLSPYNFSKGQNHDI